MIQALGLVGGLLFAYAAVPQAIRTVRIGAHLGTPLDIAACIFSGVVALYLYLLLAHGFDWVVTVTYLVEGVSWGVILGYGLLAKIRGGQRA